MAVILVPWTSNRSLRRRPSTPGYRGFFKHGALVAPNAPMRHERIVIAMQSIRRERALRDIDISTLRGVEVGPLDRPLVSKNEGEIYYVDYASTAELKKSLTS